MRMPMDCHKQEKAPTDRAARHTQWEPGGRFPKTIAQILTRWLTGLMGVETYEPEQQPASGVISTMEQRRFYEVRGEESDEWLVLDGKRHPPRVICRCVGWNAPKNAALIATALEAHDSELYSKFPIDGSGRLNEQPDVKASGEAESPPALKSATRISRSRHRG